MTYAASNKLICAYTNLILYKVKCSNDEIKQKRLLNEIQSLLTKSPFEIHEFNFINDL